MVRLSELPRSARAIILATLAGGLVSAGLVGLLTYRSFHMTGTQWVIAGIVCALDLASWVRPLVLYRTGVSQAFHFDEGFLVVMILLLPPAATVVVLASVVVVSQTIRRRPMVKSAFNLGHVLLLSSAAVAGSRAIAPPTTHLHVDSVLAACAGAIVFFAGSTFVVSALLVSLGATWRECISADLSTQLVVAFTGTLVGAVLAMDVHANPGATALAVPLLMVFRLLVAAQFKARHDRARMQGLFNVTLDANRRLSHESVIDSVLQAAREQLRCPTAVITSVEPEPGAMSAAIDTGGVSQWLAVSGRPREEPFDQADRMLLDAISAIAKGALTNADLYRQVRYERGRLASVTLNIGEGVCAVDSEGNLTFVNPAAADLVRLPTRNVSIGDSLPAETMRAPEFLLTPARSVMSAGGVIREEDAHFEGRDGHPIQVAYTASAIRQNGKVVGAVIAFRDITERKKLEAVMTRQALYDSLTGLANRRMLVERLETALNRSARDQKLHALIFVDVDRFKAINDSLGHGTGDGLLVAVATRMRQAVGTRGLVSRFGGDEFVILIEDVFGADDAVAVARRICTAVEEPLVLPDGYEIVASVSVGIAITEPGQTVDDVLRDADVAMYRAKGRGGTYQVFDKELMGTRSAERISLEAALRKGIERAELEVHYQPLVSVADGRITGAEALVRWRHPVEGLMAPDKFVPMAEETGLILPMGQFVLEEACRQIVEVRRRLGRDLPISVNLSPRQFQQSSLLTDVASVLDQAGLESHLLKFEITETMVMDDLAGATEIMKKLNRLGVHLAIDDFGTGHSSLGYLKRFPVHEVKVDRLFVKNLATDPVDTAIVKAVVDLADAMGISAVAEGVEDEEQLECLRHLKCHMAQGYLFSRPVKGHGLIQLLEQDAARNPDARASRRAGLRVV
ncbi:MAG TPA: EAL domain-containing protein [Acidimicrobiales bacterium]|jgi:diguanylate cyclase (GGDEF)-like protein/PAS domain S-box-containing protein|nr:EAL domain-containing protein [Acidimicrobiales bacterium]